MNYFKFSLVLAVSLFIFFSFFLFPRCGKETELNSYSVRDINYSKSREILLPLDSFTRPLGNYFQLLREDTLKFVLFNNYNNSLYVYDFTRESLLKKISLRNKSGELPALSGFHYLNKDSILLFPQYGDFYFICNDQGEIIPSKVKFVDEDDQNKIESHWIKSSTPIVRIDNNIYINNVFGWVAKEGDIDKYLLIEHNIITGNSEFFIQHPPSIYRKNFDSSTFRHLYYTQREDNNSILYSFAFDPYIYEYTGNKENIKSFYCAPENYTLPSRLKKGISSEDAWLHFQTNVSFSSILFDPYKNIIIRLILEPYRMEDIKSGVINPENPKKPSILLFDNNTHSLLGEIVLDSESKYYFTNIFVSKDGLWIQKILNNEDFICFELINYEI